MNSLASAAYEQFGAVHLLCNNVGAMSLGWMADLGPEEWRWMLDANLWSVINGLLAFLPRMRETPGERHILNTGSPASYVPVAGLGPFNAAKFAVAGLTETLRVELADEGIGVTMFCPAHTVTNLQATSERGRERTGSQREPPPDLTRMFRSRSQSLNETSMEAADVAQIAVRAVRENEAIVFTHPTPARKAAATERFQSILAAYPVGTPVDSSPRPGGPPPG
jgi:NAD(P)-dependent dehydrogenase (short-subunit alcohol dehydrogenase family)